MLYLCRAPISTDEFFSYILCISILGGDITALTWPEYDTPLHIAAKYGRVEIGEFLIDVGAWIQQVNRKGQTPLDIAVFKKKSTAFLIVIYDKNYHYESVI